MSLVSSSDFPITPLRLPCKKQIEYDLFLHDRRYRADDVEEIVNLIVDVMTKKKGTICL